MIPVYLQISGIYSYRNSQEIDFGKLTAAHLFGIFGAVGSGKSALLEAIIYVLYGETERLNNREQRAYNMMNLRSNDAFIRFDFLSPDQMLYRAVAKGKRNSKNKEDVKFERALYRVEGNDLVPVDVGGIESIIGISYDNFRRTIIIPQGRFQEFLQLGARDRSDMVKELFGLQRYDLAAKTGSLQKKNDEALNTCLGRIQQLGEVSPESLATLQAELEALRKDLEEATNLLKEKETAESALQKLQEMHGQLDRNRKELSTLLADQQEIDKAEKRLSDFDECVSNFKSDFSLLDDRKSQLGSRDLELQKLKESLVTATARFKEAEVNYADSRVAYESREKLLQQSRDLENCARINNRKKAVGVLTERISNGEKIIRDTIATLESFKATAKELGDLRNTLKSQLPDFNRLQQVQQWFSNNKLLQEKQNSFLRADNDLRKELESIEKQVGSLCDEAGLQRVKAAEFSLLPSLIASKKSEVELQLKQVNDEILHLEVREKLHSFASELHEGEPCPLCGSKDHPGILSIGSVEPELASLKEKRSAAEKKRVLIEKALTTSGLLTTTYAEKHAGLDVTGKNLHQASSGLEQHSREHPWPELSEGDLQLQLDKYQKIQKEIDRLDQELKTSSGKMDEENRKRIGFEEGLNKLKIELGETLKEADTLITQLISVNYTDYSSITEEALMEQSETIAIRYRQVTERYQSDEKLFRECRDNVQALNVSIANLENLLKSLKNEIEELSRQLEVRILASRFENEARIREILSLRLDRVAEQNRIRFFHEKMAAVKTAIQDLERQLEGKTYQSEVHEQVRKEIRELKTRRDQVNEQKGAKEGAVARMTRDLEESVRLQAELKTLEVRRENLRTLSELFRGQAFVNYVSTMYLQNLVNAANDRFYKLTRQQLKLELDNENNFRIRDYLNEGQWRNVKTLSGGQTFQASLCLALALADNIQQLNQGGQNFFFLDEGFGTLDRESLDLVFDTLKSLRKENRVVGVISHVEDLQQEINAWLRITRDEEHGSQVSASWEE